MAIKKKEPTMLVQARIPVSVFKSMEQRAVEECVSMADLVRRAILFTEANRAAKPRQLRISPVAQEFMSRYENKKKGARK